MGKIKKILENELTGDVQNTEVYPVTSTKAVYDENNESVSFYLNEDEGKDLIPKKLLYIANKYNL